MTKVRYYKQTDTSLFSSRFGKQAIKIPRIIINDKHNRMVFRDDLLAAKTELEKQYRELTLVLIFGSILAIVAIQAAHRMLS